MKPNEFDDLFRQRFEQHDFEYNPAGWKQLADDMDGRGKKRSLLLGWVPLMGMAASVGIAFGVTTVLKMGSNAGYLPHQGSATAKTQPVKQATMTALNANAVPFDSTALAGTIADNINTAFPEPEVIKCYGASHGTEEGEEDETNLSANAHTASAPVTTDTAALVKTIQKKITASLSEPIYTFRQDIVAAKTIKTSIILSGGYSFGSQTSGYSLGATARRMVSSKVYVEGDIAITGSTNIATTQYIDYGSGSNAARIYGNGSIAAKGGVNSKSSSEEDEMAQGGAGPASRTGVSKVATRQYNVYYAQVTPSVGYKLLKRVSIGAGPDFQQMLSDNRPALSATDRGTLHEAPIFDIGIMGKTEFAVSKNLHAAIYYREGINNIITPTNRFIDRNYMQVQIKWAILNK